MDAVSMVALGLSRPQPVGVFPMPAGYLLVSAEEENDEARQILCTGRVPEEFPAPLEYYAKALANDIEGSLDLLSRDDLISEINKLVLAPSQEGFDELTGRMDGETDPALVSHLKLVGFVLGLSDSLPDPESTDGEFAAMALAGRASQALANGDSTAAIEDLEQASRLAHPISRPLSGQLQAQMAEAQLDEGGAKRAVVTLQAALDALEGTDLLLTRAELHLIAGSVFQEMTENAPRLMSNAVNHYLQALSLVNSDIAPETVALANANLGLAYMTMPMTEASDRLRIGVAVQSMREALEYFTPETNLDRWSSTQLNLANALVYMPSKHQADNIAEAVGLYEGVLQHRDRESDPLGRARVLANQGNALAHLGVFDDAKGKLHEARFLFEEFEEHEAVRSVRSVLDEIAREESIARQDEE